MSQRFGNGCSLYSTYSPASVGDIFNVSIAEQLGVRVIQRRDMRQRYFTDKWGVVQGDGHFFMPEDATRYSYQIYDDRNTSTMLKGYLYRLDLDTLQKRPEPFLVFGSMFGSSRLLLRRPENVKLHWHLMYQFGFSHAKVLKGAKNIVQRLGGKGHFASAHIRHGKTLWQEYGEDGQPDQTDAAQGGQRLQGR